MKTKPTKIYSLQDADPKTLEGITVAVIGYGNQGRAQALNLRDSGVRVIVGNRSDDYRKQAQADGFELFDISAAVPQAQIMILLIPDEVLPAVFDEEIRPNLKPGDALVFASGYSIAFNQIALHSDVDALLLAPRMIGVGVRERYLNKDGFYCFVGVHQDASGRARERLLALTWAVSGFHKPAIEVTFKQEAILDLFNEQAFGPAFGQVLLNSISVLLEQGLPPEAVLVEMYLSEEMAYTYRKMAQVGLVKQTLFHSPTSQYGAMSRGVRFLNMGLKEKMKKIYGEIESGAFAREWQIPLARLKFKAIRFFAMRQWINAVETQVRKTLGMKEVDVYEAPADIDEVLRDPAIQAELEKFEDAFKF
jgi:ketol-acid reductoisomerase